MAKQIRTLVAILSVPFALSAGVANASDGTTCSGEVGDVRTAISAGSFTNEINRTNLLAKVDAAVGKLSLNKPSDAIDIFQAVSDKATELATATRPKLGDATPINDAAAAAIVCIGISG